MLSLFVVIRKEMLLDTLKLAGWYLASIVYRYIMDYYSRPILLDEVRDISALQTKYVDL